MNPTTTPARASSDELARRSSGKMSVNNPMRKMIEATRSEGSEDLVFFAMKSLTVHTSMTTKAASSDRNSVLDLRPSDQRRASS